MNQTYTGHGHAPPEASAFKWRRDARRSRSRSRTPDYGLHGQPHNAAPGNGSMRDGAQQSGPAVGYAPSAGSNRMHAAVSPEQNALAKIQEPELMGQGRFVRHAPPDMIPTSGHMPLPVPPDVAHGNGGHAAIDDTAMTNSMQRQQALKHEAESGLRSAPAGQAPEGKAASAGQAAVLSKDATIQVLALCNKRLDVMLADIEQRLLILSRRKDATRDDAAATAAATAGLSGLQGAVCACTCLH